MPAIYSTLKQHWTAHDTFLATVTTAAFFAFLGNCWWQSVWVCYAASAVPLIVIVAWILNKPTRAMYRAMVFGLLVGLAWPVGEAAVTHTVDWWGDYVAPGGALLYTPVYCVLIGWLASTYLFYLAQRLPAVGITRRTACLVTGAMAFFIGVLGENLFVIANMWTYERSWQDLWYVPAFVPVAYGIGYGVLPAVQHRDMARVFGVWTVTTLIASVGLGLATGFFPR